MTKDTRFKEQRCNRVLSRLDSYVDGELLAETNLELLEHFQGCSACAAEAGSRALLRQRLRTAVRELHVPADLEARVRAGLRAPAPKPSSWNHRVMVLAACLTVCIGAWLIYEVGAVRMKAGWQESYIAALSDRVVSIMRVGLGDHLHCAVLSDRPKQVPTIEALQAQIGTEYRGLPSLVRERVPADMDLMTAHQCRYHSRKFLHLAFRAEGGLLSLVIARKNEGESFDIGGLSPALSASGVALYGAKVERYQLAAFETQRFLVYTISDLPALRNMDVMASLAPALAGYLQRLG